MKPFLDMPHPRFKFTALLLMAVFASMSLQPDVAAALTKRSRKSQPASPRHAAPDVTSTIPTLKEPPVAAPAPVAPPQAASEEIPAPYYLPNAPRARMRHCGEEWQTIKMAGQAEDKTWREFAAKCLAQADDIKKANR